MSTGDRRNTDDHNLSDELRAVLDELPASNVHPTLEELLDLTLDALPEARAEEIRDHLERCRECQHEVKRLLTIPQEPPRPEQRVGVEEMYTAWQRLGTRLEAEDQEKAAPGKVVSLAQRRTVDDNSTGWRDALPHSLPRLLAVAALLMLSFGLGRWNQERGSGLALTQFASEQAYVRGAGGGLQEAACPVPNGDFAWLLFAGGALKGQALYDVEIRPADGRLWRLERLATDGKGTLALRLSRAAVADGEYYLRVLTSEEQELRAEFRFRVQCR